MTIRTFQPGDEAAQVGIYNEAAAELPRFKPASLDEVRRRLRDPAFDPRTRLYALAQGKPVAYATWQHNGRVSFPWARKGYEALAGPLFDQALDAMRAAGLTRAFAAYRGDWAPMREFFLARGFEQTREMLNFVLDLVEMPTPAARPTSSVGPLTPEDLFTLTSFSPRVLRLGLPELEEYLFRNPYFPSSSLFGLRNRSNGDLIAAGILIVNDTYADPHQLDSAMPCFRLGAFGTEGLTTKRVNGLFSLLVQDPQKVASLGLELLSHAAFRLQDSNIGTLAAQVPSDATPLVRFYRQYFRFQDRFPLYERGL